MHKTIIEINTNTVTGMNYDRDGNSFRDGSPSISIRSNFLLKWRLFTETPDADNSGVDVSKWTPASFENCGALLTCDDDFKHRISGTLLDPITSGVAVTEISIRVGTGSAVEIPASGIVAIYTPSGGLVEMEYSSRVVSSGVAVCTLAAEFVPAEDIPAGAVANISQSPLFQRLYDAENSNPSAGLFVFDAYAFSSRLAAIADTSSSKSISIQGLEILPFIIDGDKFYELPSYLIDTVSLTINLGEISSQIPEESPDSTELINILAAIILSGVDVQVYSEEGGWREYSIGGSTSGITAWRMRLTAAGEGSEKWSGPIPVIKGNDAPEVKIQYSADAQDWDAPAADADYARFSTDGGNTWGDAVSTRGRVGSPGTNAPQVKIQYSVDAVDWTASESDAKYIRFSTDGGNTWADALYTKGQKGDKGDRGAAFTIDATGTLAERSLYDAEAKDFSYLATDNGNVYIKASDTSGDWSDPIPFKGDKGDKPFNTKGDWNEETAYIADDAVTHNGSFYIALADSTGVEPGTNAVYWQLYVSKGEKGEPGKDGADGVLEENYIDIDSVTDGYLVLDDETIPVSVEIEGKVYPVLGMERSGTNFKIPVSPILAAANLAEYVGIWRVWRAGGKPGDRGPQGVPGNVAFDDLTAEQLAMLTPQKGVDYWTEEDREEIMNDFVVYLETEKW